MPFGLKFRAFFISIWRSFTVYTRVPTETNVKLTFLTFRKKNAHLLPRKSDSAVRTQRLSADYLFAVLGFGVAGAFLAHLTYRLKK